MTPGMYSVIKRSFDFIVSLISLIILLPFFLLIAITIRLDSRGPVFYIQNRVGKNFKDFRMYKFRTMKTGAEQEGLLTVGANDKRITSVGRFLRRYKLDELPQLFNVLTGNMSIVGPRPEVKKYVDLYNEEQRKVLTVKPGITDLVSIRFFNENEILARYADAEEGYIKEVMPQKLILNLEYIQKQNFLSDLKIIFKTVKRTFFDPKS